jgi:hypothetical protein
MYMHAHSVLELLENTSVENVFMREHTDSCATYIPVCSVAEKKEIWMQSLQEDNMPSQKHPASCDRTESDCLKHILVAIQQESMI